ncbi:RHS repeat-associated core domain-containing protein, partial [Hoeflea poritis]
AYASYGEPTNAAMATQKGYINERHDPETGLMYLNARYMDPSFGRFISPMTGTPSSMASDQTDTHMHKTIPSIRVIQTGMSRTLTMAMMKTSTLRSPVVWRLLRLTPYLERKE